MVPKRINFRYFFLIVLGIFCFFTVNHWLNYEKNNRILDLDYPDFLKINNSAFVNKKINNLFLKEDYSEDDLGLLWKLLFIKMDKMDKKTYDYITEGMRKIFCEKIIKTKINSPKGRYYQVDLLKYKLGINNAGELKKYVGDGNVCDNNNLNNSFFNYINWGELRHVSIYFDVINFCELNYTQNDVDRLNLLINVSNDDNLKQHTIEHGVNDVPVYVNDCSRATNLNEEYHCLFFQK